MDQDAILYRCRPWSRWHCVRWGPSFPKGAQPRPICGPCLLWPKGWMDQDVTWYGGRPRPRRHCVRWGPTSPERGTAVPSFRPMSIVANTAEHLLHLRITIFLNLTFCSYVTPPSGVEKKLNAHAELQIFSIQRRQYFTARRHTNAILMRYVPVCLSVSLSQVSVLLKRLNVGSGKQLQGHIPGDISGFRPRKLPCIVFQMDIFLTSIIGFDQQKLYLKIYTHKWNPGYVPEQR